MSAGINRRKLQRLATMAILEAICFFGLPLQAQWNFLGDPLISTAAVSSQAIALSHQSQVHVAYTSNGAAKVSHFDGNDWILSSAIGLPNTGANTCGMVFSPNNDPYLAIGSILSVYKFSLNQWQPISGLPFVNNAKGIQIRMAASGIIWLAWFEAGAIDTTHLMSYDQGIGWTTEGLFQERLVDFELDDQGAPIILLRHAPALLHLQSGVWQSITNFSHPNEDYVALAMHYDGTNTGAIALRSDSMHALSAELLSLGSWVPLGQLGFANGDQLDLGIDHNGVAHVLSVDNANNGLPQVNSFLAGNWQLVGGQFVYNNTVSLPMLAFDPSASYVLFQDDEQYLRNSVMFLGLPSGQGESTIAAECKIWPNPASNEIHLELEREIVGGRLQISDVVGRLKMTLAPASGQRFCIAIAHLPMGQYFFTLESAHQSPMHGSFLKNAEE